MIRKQTRKMRCAFTRKQAGFSLVEVIVALVIAAILAAIAYPSYREAVCKGKRAEGRAALVQLLQQEERYYTQHNSYIQFSFASSDDEERKFKWFSGNAAKSSAYVVKAEPCSNDTIQNCVKLIAKPGTSRVDSSFQDPTCGDLGITSTGIKTADREECWK